MDHFLCQLDDFHRFPHVQDEYITALPHSARLNHQLSGFGNRHEIPGDFGMGDGQRPARLYLLMEKRDH
ncbi:hypothetical protein D3C81_1672500 [compost metagenome]